MPLLQVVLVLVVVGVLLWLVNSFIPMQGTIKSILNAIVVIAVVVWLLNVFGLLHDALQASASAVERTRYWEGWQWLEASSCWSWG